MLYFVVRANSRVALVGWAGVPLFLCRHSLQFSLIVVHCSPSTPFQAHTSIRFGIGRFTTEAEVDRAVDLTVQHVNKVSSRHSAWCFTSSLLWVGLLSVELTVQHVNKVSRRGRALLLLLTVCGFGVCLAGQLAVQDANTVSSMRCWLVLHVPKLRLAMPTCCLCRTYRCCRDMISAAVYSQPWQTPAAPFLT